MLPAQPRNVHNSSPNRDIHESIVRRVTKERSVKDGVIIVLPFQVR